MPSSQAVTSGATKAQSLPAIVNIKTTRHVLYVGFRGAADQRIHGIQQASPPRLHSKSTAYAKLVCLQGHFQIVLSNDHCPLFQSRLTWFQRIMYCSGVWSYIVGAIATPFFIAVPLVTIWAGIFPIVVSEWAASKSSTSFKDWFLSTNYPSTK